MAERFAAFGHSNLEEFWTLLWRDPSLKASAIDALPLAHHFKDSGVVFRRTSWGADATAVAFKAGPPEGHRVASLLPRIPEWRLDSGHAQPDAGSFIIWSGGKYLTGDTGYAGLPSARNHNTLTFGGVGQGIETQHDVWRDMSYAGLDGIRIREADLSGRGMKIVADLGPAYGPKAALTSLTRTFTWDGANVFTVADNVSLKTKAPAEWHLQSDAAFITEGKTYQIGPPTETSLVVSFDAPAGLNVKTGPALVRAPGPPGSIEKGHEEPRGFVLTGTAPADTAMSFRVRLEIRPGR